MSDIFRVDFYAKDWLLDTQCLTPEQRGIYIQIVSAMWSRNEAIMDDDRWLSNLCNCSVRKIKAVKLDLIAGGFISISEGKIYQKRALEEVENARQRREKASKNARKHDENEPKTSRNSDENEGELNKNSDLTSASQQSTVNSQQIDTNVSINPHTPRQKNINQNLEMEFEQFWQDWRPYDMAKGNKQTALKNFTKARREGESYETIVEGSERYIDHCHRTECKTQHVSTWLYQRGWESDWASPDKPQRNTASTNSGSKPSYSDRLRHASSQAQAIRMGRNSQRDEADIYQAGIEPKGLGFDR